MVLGQRLPNLLLPTHLPHPDMVVPAESTKSLKASMGWVGNWSERGTQPEPEFHYIVGKEGNATLGPTICMSMFPPLLTFQSMHLCLDFLCMHNASEFL